MSASDGPVDGPADDPVDDPVDGPADGPVDRTGRPRTLLLVDDQPVFRIAIRAMLEGLADERPAGPGARPDGAPAFTVVGEAGDGEQAVALASSLRPDVVLMDVRMPGVDGAEATRRILARDASTTVVLMSTARRADLAADLLDCGAVGFLAKETLDPASLSRLLRTPRAPVSDR